LSEHEWDEISFLKPANQDFAAPDFQQIFDHHLKVVEQMRAHALRTQQPGNFDWEIYVHGFIVITRADWREHGVTAVHCEQDRAKWKVVQCRLPVAQLDSLYGIMEMDEYFDNLCEYYDGSSLPSTVQDHLRGTPFKSEPQRVPRYLTLAVMESSTAQAKIVWTSLPRYCRRG
jgi:hypothetical protein